MQFATPCLGLLLHGSTMDPPFDALRLNGVGRVGRVGRPVLATSRPRGGLLGHGLSLASTTAPRAASRLA